MYGSIKSKLYSSSQRTRRLKYHLIGNYSLVGYPIIAQSYVDHELKKVHNPPASSQKANKVKTC